MGGHDRHALGQVDAQPAAQGDQVVAAFGLAQPGGRAHIRFGRVAERLVKHGLGQGFQPGQGQVQHSGCAHAGIGDDRGAGDANALAFGAMGYKFQFITLAGFHSLNYGMFDLAYGYARHNMTAFVELQQKEFAAADRGFTAVKHQREVGTGYFDAVTTTIEALASTGALKGSTEDDQFFDAKHG